MNIHQLQFLRSACEAAKRSDHVFPEMAACEAALESAYGSSQLARADFNLFGMKQHRHAIYGTHSLPTKEFLRGEWVVTIANWIRYPSWDECFRDRMSTLLRLAPQLPHYAAALNAASPEVYINEVSKTWSTDPGRAAKVIAIYDQMNGLWAGNQTQEHSNG